MIDYSPTVTPPVADFCFDRRINSSLWNAPYSAEDAANPLARPLESFAVGAAVYQFREPAAAIFLPRWRGRIGQAYVRSVVGVLGEGETFDAALDDWKNRFHDRYQSLAAARPWERTPEVDQAWRELRQVIDTEAHRRGSPVVVRQIGRKGPPKEGLCRVTWEDGSRDAFPLCNAPGELADYQVGQRFVAEVERDPVTWRPRRLASVRKLNPLGGVSAERGEAIWQSIAKTSDGPTGSWSSID